VSGGLRLALAAEESAGVQVLQRLQKSGADVALVLASKKRSGQLGGSVWDSAAKAGCETLAPTKLKRAEFAGELRDRGIDLLLTVRCPFIVHGAVLDAPRLGAFNLHTGPLPSHAGRNVVSWAIYEGRSEHGITVHRTVEEVDAGPIAYERRFPIGADDGALDVLRRSIREGVQAVLELVRQASEDPEAIPARDQDGSARRVYGREAPEQLAAPLAGDARSLRDLIRACRFFPFPSPWGTPVLRAGEESVGLLGVGPPLEAGPADAAPGTLSAAGAADADGVLLAARSGWVELTEVEWRGERTAAREALAGVAQLA
jgi:methionyl-tRNA formyltransferase